MIYLGANVPVSDMECVVATMKPELAFVHLGSNFSQASMEKMITDIKLRIPTVKTIISGCPAEGYDRPIPPCIELKCNLREVMDLISTL